MRQTLKTIGNMFKKKTIKKFLGILILFGVSSMFLANNKVVAQIDTTPNQTNTTEESKIKNMSELNEIFTYISNAIYALLWPVLFIIGISLDNTLVYGSFLHLDASLWTLWNIMKNFANFALGFLVLFAIVRNIFAGPFGGKSGEKRGPISVIKKTLIAGVLIQASWFVVAAVVDISTILTYSIGGLPMTIMQNNPEQNDQPILGLKAVVNTKGSGGINKMSLQYYSTYGDESISPCYTSKNIPGLTGEYIVGRKEIVVKSGQNFISGYCTLGGWPYRYKENPAYSDFLTGTNESYITNLKNYFETGTNNEETYSGLLADCSIIAIDFSNLSETCKNQGYGILKKDDAFFKNAGDSNTTKFTLTNVLEKSKGFVGPFITIYSSMLNFSDLAGAAPGESVVGDFLDLIIKIFFAAILFIPLVVLAIVLIVRIGMLRLIIAASPVLVLVAVFKKELNIKGSGDGMMAYFDGAQIVKLIFAPVFVVFAISMSMIFLSALNTRDIQKNSGLSNEQFEELGITKNKDSFSFLGLVEIELDMKRINEGMDMLSWFITMFFATGIMRFFLFFAIRMTKIGDKIGKGFQESAQNLAKNLPIIPIGGGAVGIKAAQEGLQQLGGKLSNQLNTQQRELLQERFPWLYPGVTDKNRGDAGTLEQLSQKDLNPILESIKTKGVDKTFDDNKTLLTGAGITSGASLSTAYNEYVVNHISQFDNLNDVMGTSAEDPDQKNITTFTAERFRSATIESNIKSSDNRKKRAKTAVGTNVKTADGIKILVNSGTSTSPNFKLLTQKEYSDKYMKDIKDQNGSFDEKKLEEILKKQIKDEAKPSDKSDNDWKKEQEDWIQEQLDLHKKEMEKRLKPQQNSQSNQSNQATPSTASPNNSNSSSNPTPSP
ncbi:MAG: type IV secretion system protein [Candidatus Absconditabacterales bacterium]|nr:type IV secretion system protein [Candidatus Absconditabacterales bacterium]